MKTTIENVFAEPRKEGDIDLIAQITDLLQKANHPNPQAWQAHPTIQEAFNKSPKLQLFLINRYWRLELGSYPEDTCRQRYCLTDDCPFGEYVKIFEAAILPVVLRNNVVVI